MPRKPATDKPAATAEAATAVRSRRTLSPLPGGWKYAVTLTSPAGDDSTIKIAPEGEGYAVAANLGGHQSSTAVADLAAGLDLARDVLKRYESFQEQRLAFERTLGIGIGATEVAVEQPSLAPAHVDAEGATTAVDVTPEIDKGESPTTQQVLGE